MPSDPLISIGTVARRTGMAVSAVRYYADRNLIPATRSAGNKRLFHRSVIRRLSFILISQQLGYSLEEIAQLLASLPDERTPGKKDWHHISNRFRRDIDGKIARLQQMRDTLDGCIGCGCLSLANCRLYNPKDGAASLGSGPRYLLGDSSADIVRSSGQP